MATVRKKKVTARPLKSSARKPSAAKRRTGSSGSNITARQVLPYFLSFCIVVCIVAIAALGYRSATASNFFSVVSVEVRGIERASRTEIERIVLAETEKSGAWNADL